MNMSNFSEGNRRGIQKRPLLDTEGELSIEIIDINLRFKMARHYIRNVKRVNFIFSIFYCLYFSLCLQNLRDVVKSL